MFFSWGKVGCTYIHAHVCADTHHQSVYLFVAAVELEVNTSGSAHEHDAEQNDGVEPAIGVGCDYLQNGTLLVLACFWWPGILDPMIPRQRMNLSRTTQRGACSSLDVWNVIVVVTHR